MWDEHLSYSSILRVVLCAKGLMYLAKSRTCCFPCLYFIRWSRCWRIPFCFAESMKIKLMNESFCGTGFKNLQKSSPTQHCPFENFFSHHYTVSSTKLTETSHFQQFSRVFSGRSWMKIHLLCQSSPLKKHVLMSQGSQCEHWRCFSSIIKVNTESPAVLLQLTEGTKVDTTNSAVSSRREA